jgi:hypothetical protein
LNPHPKALSAKDLEIIENSRKPEEVVQEDEPQIYEVESEPVVQEVVAPKKPTKVPEIRKTEKKGVEFTEKKYGHLPSRESHSREPPFPKSKKIEKKDDTYINAEDTDPVWLKDKGDHFYRRNDFVGAVRAYSKALEADKDIMSAKLNRATTFLKARGFQSFVEDCTEIQVQIDGMSEEQIDEDREYFDKMYARSLVKRAAGYTWSSQF